MVYSVDFPGINKFFETCIDTQSVGSREESITLAIEMSVQLGWALVYGFENDNYSFCFFFIHGVKQGV
jgi:hypothetical protein